MVEDVSAALDRFQNFLGRFGASDVVDHESGFTVADGILLAGEVEMASAQHIEPDESPID